MHNETTNPFSHEVAAIYDLILSNIRKAREIQSVSVDTLKVNRLTAIPEELQAQYEMIT